MLLPSWLLPALALLVSLFALTVAFLNYRRKSAISVRGGFSLASSIECEDKYVASVVLENMKDRAVTIYSIHLLAGHNHLIEIEDFESSPLILKPFETITREYGPIEFYGVNDSRIDMSPLLADANCPKRLALSTSHGRYDVRKFPKRWNPVVDHFKNHALALVRPVRANYKGKSIGGNVTYVLDIVLSDDKSEILMIHPGDHRVQRFRNFRLTADSLESADALRSYLAERQSDGSLMCKSFTVFDVQTWRANERDFYRGRPVRAERIGYLKFKVLVRLATLAADRALRRQNQELKKAHSKAGDA